MSGKDFKELVKALSKSAPSSYIRLLKSLRRSVRSAILKNERRMVVLVGDVYDLKSVLLGRTIALYSKWVREVKGDNVKVKVLYMFNPDFPESRFRREVFSETLKVRKPKNVTVEYSPIQESERYLGTTYDVLVLDLHENLKPNDLGRLIGIVRGGGLVVLLIPEWDEWEKTLTLFQRELATPQHPENEVRQVFKKWFKRKLLEHKGIFIYNVDKRKTIKALKNEVLDEISKKKEEIKVPEKTVYPKELYNLALTQDQINVL